MQDLITTGALLALLGSPVTVAQTTGSVRSSAQSTSSALPSSLRSDTRMTGRPPAGQGVFIGGFATSYAVAVAAAAGAAANGNPSGPATIWPIEAISYELGSERAIGYFEPRGGRCQVTLMIAEASDPGGRECRACERRRSRNKAHLWRGSPDRCRRLQLEERA